VLTPASSTEAVRAPARALDACYRVWAPAAQSVALRAGGVDTPMTPDARGWWTSSRRCRHHDDYGFVVDGGEPLPDPRSPFQPDGVHGLSRWIDHDEFQWQVGDFQPPPLGSAVIYELHIGTFSPRGTFDGAIERLDALVELGITHVELMPICEFAGRRGWGYDGVDLFAPHHAYGGPDGLKRLIDACHRRGLAVILDVVYNHAGPAGCYLQRFGPYFTGRHRTAWGDAANLDGPDSDEVRRFFIDNALMWLRDYRIDALRLDAIHAFVDFSAVPFLRQLTGEVKQLEAMTGRHLSVIAESDLNDPRVIRSADAGGYGADAQWSDDFHHSIHAYITGERAGYYEDFGTLGDLAIALCRGFVYDGRYSSHRRRVHGDSPDGIPGWRFVVSTQTHDQIGNRARGERLWMLTSPGRVRIAAALLMTSRYVPMLFQGEEWGATSPFLYFTDHDDELGAQIRDGRRQEFPAFAADPDQVPDPQAASTFEQSRLRWTERAADGHAELLRWYISLIALRREIPSLRNGASENCRVVFDDAQEYLVMHRGEVVVACNFADVPRSMALPDRCMLRLASDAVELGRNRIVMAPESVAILTIAGPVRS
jgi:maltooligosyltrehalose trehalohydrolase